MGWLNGYSPQFNKKAYGSQHVNRTYLNWMWNVTGSNARYGIGKTSNSMEKVIYIPSKGQALPEAAILRFP